MRRLDLRIKRAQVVHLLLALASQRPLLGVVVGMLVGDEVGEDSGADADVGHRVLARAGRDCVDIGQLRLDAPLDGRRDPAGSSKAAMASAMPSGAS